MAKEADTFTKYLWYTILVFSFADFIVSCAVASAQVNDGGYRGMCVYQHINLYDYTLYILQTCTLHYKYHICVYVCTRIGVCCNLVNVPCLMDGLL